jgi:hypothetical protein
MLKKILEAKTGISGGWRKLHNNRLNLYILINFVRRIELSTMGEIRSTGLGD